MCNSACQTTDTSVIKVDSATQTEEIKIQEAANMLSEEQQSDGDKELQKLDNEEVGLRYYHWMMMTMRGKCN